MRSPYFNEKTVQKFDSTNPISCHIKLIQFRATFMGQSKKKKKASISENKFSCNREGLCFLVSLSSALGPRLCTVWQHHKLTKWFMEFAVSATWHGRIHLTYRHKSGGKRKLEKCIKPSGYYLNRLKATKELSTNWAFLRYWSFYIADTFSQNNKKEAEKAIANVVILGHNEQSC